MAAAATADWINISGNIWKSARTFLLIGGNGNGLPYDNANEVGNVTWGTYPNRSFGVMLPLPGQSDASLTTQGQWLFNTTDLKVHIFSAGNPATAMPGLELGVDASMIEATGTNFATVQNFSIFNGAGHGGTAANPTVYSFLDFDAGTSNVYIDNTHSYIDFYGCRFQSNNVAGANVDLVGATNIRFFYCSFVPRVALVGTTPPNAAWPSAGAGTGIIDQPNIYMIPYANSYTYGVNCSTGGTGGPFIIDHCDIWGCQDAITFYATTAQILVNNNWIHDFADSNNAFAHQDGPGYLNGTVGPTNVSITDNTITSIMNGFPISYQVAATAPSSNLLIKMNYICGWSDAVVLQNTSTVLLAMY